MSNIFPNNFTKVNPFEVSLEDFIVGNRNFNYPHIAEGVPGITWLGNWAKRMELSVDFTKIDSILTHFPIPFILGESQSAFFNELLLLSEFTSNDTYYEKSNKGYTIEKTGNDSAWDNSRNNFEMGSGKWYWEVRVDLLDTYQIIGVVELATTGYPGSTSRSYGYAGANGEKYNSATGISYGDTYTDNDVIGVALDLENGKIYFSKNNVWQDSGDPVSGSGEAYSGLSGSKYASVGCYYTDSKATLLGQQDQVYSTPVGYESLMHRSKKMAIADSDANQLYVEKVQFQTSIKPKSLAFDLVDNYGDDQLALRSIEFKKGGVRLDIEEADYTTYASNTYSGTYDSKYIFDTSLSKTGTSDNTSWVTGTGHGSGERVVIVFDELPDFDEIVLNNYHRFGAITNRGVKNWKIYSTDETLSSAVYEDSILNYSKIYEGEMDEHPATDTVDDQSMDELELFSAIYWASKSDLELSSSKDTKLYLYYDSAQEDNTDYVSTHDSETSQYTPNAGLYLEPDTSPYTGTTLLSDSGLIDGNKWSGQAGNQYWLTHYSYGVDLGSVKTVGSLQIHTSHAGTAPVFTYYSNYDTIDLYKSDDNSTWELVENYDAPPIIFAEGYHVTIELAFPAETARYFKAVCTATGIAYGAGLSARVQEVEAFSALPHYSVWDEYFKLVYHMDQDPSGGADCIKDSTINNNHGTPAGTMLTEDLVAGQIGKAIALDGSDDEIEFSAISLTDWTMEILARNPNGGTVNDGYVVVDGAGIVTMIDMKYALLQGDAAQVLLTDAIKTDIYEYIAASRTGTTYKIYEDGVEDTNIYVNAGWGLSGVYKIGYGYGAYRPEVELNVVRISSIVRTAAWIKATQNALANTLLTIGSEETL